MKRKMAVMPEKSSLNIKEKKMKTQSTKREKVLLVLMAMYVLINSSIQAQQMGTNINTFYATYIRTGLIALVVLFFIITALFHIQDFKDGGKAAKDAFIHCLLMAVYPAVVLGLAEAVHAIMQGMASSIN